MSNNSKVAKTETEGFEWGTIRVGDHGFFSEEGGEAVIAKHPLSWWVKNYGVPLHIQYGPTMLHNIREFKEVFRKHYPNGHIRFAGKVNTHPSVFKMMADEKVGVDVASFEEMRCALESGVPPTELDVNGNCKSDALIEEAIKRDMFLIADCIEEFETIAALAKRLGIKPRVALRLTGFELGHVTDADVFTAGTWSKFGTHLDDIPAFIQSLHRVPHVDFQGFHAHIGSQVTEPSAYHTVLGIMLELSHELKRAGISTQLVNIGGGFPAQYIEKHEWEYLLRRIEAGYRKAKAGDPSQIFVWENGVGGFDVGPDGEVDFGNWSGEKMVSDYPRAAMLQELLTGSVTVFGKKKGTVEALEELGKPRLVIEPGRSIACDSGVTLARVGHVRKVAGGHNLVTLEASVTSYATAMLLPPVNPWTILNDSGAHDPEPFETFVAGNLCYSGDIISKYKVFLQRKPQRGDIVASYHTGAYDPNFFAANTNSFPRPARVFVDREGEVCAIKTRDTHDRNLFPRASKLRVGEWGP